ncbi:MAG: DUF354 domain-containing protein [Bacteroidales bacterium]|nr:DUF354 domain-containing protein [Bacteroidales bacterium]
MNILVDIGHPAHVHFFYPIIKRLKKQGYNILLSIREKDCSVQIACSYKLNYITKGKGSYSFLLKPFYLVRSVRKIYSIAKKFKPDIFLSFASPYAGLVSRLLNKPHIVFDDTEPDPVLQCIYRNFSTQIITPACFQKDFGKKHIKINSYKELAYLSPQNFQTDPDFRKELGFQNDQEYILVRLVNHGAMHDLFSKKWPYADKMHFVERLTKIYPIVISSEIPLPQCLEKFRFRLSEDKFLHALAHAKILVGESATVATESAMLGVPALFIDYSTRGYINEIEKEYGLIKHLQPTENELKKAEDFIHHIMKNPVNKEYQQNKQKLLSEKDDVVGFMVETVNQTLLS